MRISDGSSDVCSSDLLGDSGFIFSLGAEGGYIKGLGQDVRLTDRFFLGEPQIRGFGIRGVGPRVVRRYYDTATADPNDFLADDRSEEHTSELQSLMRISYAVFCLKKKKKQ